jgi:hypothetical protein
MSDRHRLCWFRAIAVIAALAVPSVAASAPDHPNVVIFLADDLGWGDVGFHGGEQIDTPSLDRLAREGAELHRFYATPICSPTRAALMTGRDPMRLGVAYAVILPWHTIGPGARAADLPPQRARLRALLRAPPHRGRLLPSVLEPGRQGLPEEWEVHRRRGLRELPAGRRGGALDPGARPRAALLPVHAVHRAAHAPRRARRPEPSTPTWKTTASRPAAGRPTAPGASASSC